MEQETFTPQTWGDYFSARQAKTEKLEKIVLTLLQQCKDEGLTVSDLKLVCEMASRRVLDATLREGLAL